MYNERKLLFNYQVAHVKPMHSLCFLFFSSKHLENKHVKPNDLFGPNSYLYPVENLIFHALHVYSYINATCIIKIHTIS